MKSFALYSYLAAALSTVLACDSCYGPQNTVVHTRNVRRMQPGAPSASVGPKAPLDWGQLNFLHTVCTTRPRHLSLHRAICFSLAIADKADARQTDTHGWLEGHIKEQNYGADWGDFKSFTEHMKHTAGNLGVDLLIIDTGKSLLWSPSLFDPMLSLLCQVIFMMAMDSVMLPFQTAYTPTPSLTKLTLTS